MFFFFSGRLFFQRWPAFTRVPLPPGSQIDSWGLLGLPQQCRDDKMHWGHVATLQVVAIGWVQKWGNYGKLQKKITQNDGNDGLKSMVDVWMSMLNDRPNGKSKMLQIMNILNRHIIAQLWAHKCTSTGQTYSMLCCDEVFTQVFTRQLGTWSHYIVDQYESPIQLGLDCGLPGNQWFQAQANASLKPWELQELSNLRNILINIQQIPTDHLGKRLRWYADTDFANSMIFSPVTWRRTRQVDPSSFHQGGSAQDACRQIVDW